MRRSPEFEISLGAHPTTQGLEVVEIDPAVAPPAPPPVRLLEGLPSAPQAEYGKAGGDATGTQGIWTAIEHLEPDRKPKR